MHQEHDAPRSRRIKKRWLTALVAAALAAVEVILPHATPVAEAVVRAIDLGAQLGPVDGDLPGLPEADPKSFAS